jgi:hypothetical protein
MKQYAEHNRIGICNSLRGNEMYKRVYSGGYPYLNNGLIVRSSSIVPIYSYGKNYKKHDSDFALFVWTTESDAAKIEKLFENTLDSVTKDNIDKISDKGSFVYIH